ISQFQREVHERTASAREELSSATEETKKTIERFDFERRGLESVTQRVADLRAAVSECESRYRPLSDSTRSMTELLARSETLGAQLGDLTTQASALDGEIGKLATMRRELDEASGTARDLGVRVQRIEESRAAVDAGLRDLATLAASHAAVRD